MTAESSTALGRRPFDSSGFLDLRWGVQNWFVLTLRGLMRNVREPSQLLDVTLQPVALILLFGYVLGSAVDIGGNSADYREYLVGGMFAATVVGTAIGTSVAVTTDVTTGLVDRLRSLPIARSAVLAGRVTSDAVSQIIAFLVITITGLCVGWGIHDGLANALFAYGLCLFMAFAMTWVGAFLGLLVGNTEGAQALGFIVFFPLSLVSTIFVPTSDMTPWLQTIANWNPASALATACRELFGNPTVHMADAPWPLRHPVAATLLWGVLLIAVFAPAAVYLYQRRTR